MKVFLSWSGERSRRVAEQLRIWLPNVLPGVVPWMSSRIEAGTRWTPAIEKQLRAARYGILCITPENETMPWLVYEAGFLARKVPVCPYLIDYERDVVPGPLQQVQNKRANRGDTLDVVQSIAHEAGLDPAEVARRFDECWPALEAVLAEVADMETDREELGFVSIHKNRSAALDAFQHAIEVEKRLAEKGHGFRFWVVGSSLSGFAQSSDTQPWLRFAAAHPGDVRFLLTFPDKVRAARDPDAIAFTHAVAQSVATLREMGIDQQSVRYCYATPRTFAIATSRYMLINPYPYKGPAFTCFSIIVEATRQSSGIFSQYLDMHFQQPFDAAIPIPDADWNPGSPPLLRARRGALRPPPS